jgi:hypothetical protein
MKLVRGAAAASAGLPRLELPLSRAVTVLVSSYVIRVQTMWHQAPITAALVIATGLMSRE